jgi:regulator of protease activity HflC (stomatin/prohibitin superfamily)
MIRFVQSMNTGVITTFGKLTRLAAPGLNIYIPFIQRMHIVSNRLCENQCNITVRTADKVFPRLDITIQYRVLPEDSGRAQFELADPVQQMISYTDNVVRKSSSGLTLDQLFESQSHVADAII